MACRQRVGVGGAQDTLSHPGSNRPFVCELMSMRHFLFFPGSIPSCVEFTTSANFANVVLEGIWYQRFEDFHRSSQMVSQDSDRTHCHARQVSDLALAQAGDRPLTLIRASGSEKNADFRLGLIFSSRLVHEARNSRSLNSRCVSPSSVYERVCDLVRGEPPVDCFGEEFMVASSSIFTWLWIAGCLSMTSQ